MGEINERISITDDFSNKLDKFCSLLEDSANALSKARDEFKDFFTKPLKGVRALTEAWSKLKTTAEEYADNRGVKALEEEARLRSLYGDLEGKSAITQYRRTANELGRDTDTYLQNALTMNRAGFGSDDVKEWSKVADRMALITGEAFESVLSGLTSDATSHSTGNMASLLGGGQGVERMLKRAGVERMLNRGDLTGALDAFTKIADQLGYSEKAAESMANTVRNKVEKTVNKIDNAIKSVERHVANVIKPSFDAIADTVNHIADSKLFTVFLNEIKTVISYVGKGVEVIAVIFNKISNTVVDFVDKHIVWFQYLFDIVPKIFGILVGIKAIKLAVFGATIAFKLLLGAVKLLMLPFAGIGLVVVSGLVLAAEAFGMFWKNETGESINFVQKLLGMAFQVGGFVKGVIEDVGVSFYNIFQHVREWISAFIGFVVDGARWLWRSLKSVIFDGLTFAIDVVLEKLQKALEFIGKLDAAAKLAEIRGDLAEALSVKAEPFEEYERYKGQFKEYKNPIDEAREAAQKGVELGGEITKAFTDKFGHVITEFKDNVAGIKRDTGKMRGMMSEAQEVAWLKELSERQYINRLNVQSPNITQNISITNRQGATGKDMIKELENALVEQQQNSGYGVGLIGNKRGA